MDGLKLDLAGLRDKVSSKLQTEKTKPEKKKNNKKNNQKDENQSQGNQGGYKRTEKPQGGYKRAEKPQGGYKRAEKKPEEPSKEEDPKEILRREALELGATEEDLKLIEGIDDGEESEQEFNDVEKPLDKGFKNDLTSFMKGLGLDKGEPVIVKDDDVEPELVEEDDDEEEAEEQEDQEDEEPEQEPEQELEEESESEDDGEDIEQEHTQIFQPAPEEKVEQKPQHQKIESTTILNSSRLIVPPRIDWYNIPIELSEEPAQLNQVQIDRLYHKGKEALEADNTMYYEEFSKSSSQKKFLSQILSDGTLNDKISALTLLVQEAPLHNTKSLDTLLGFCNKKSRNSQLQSLNALKDMFINGLLPDRKLRYFKNQPLNNMLTKRQLALFYFEDYLKQYYFKVIQILEKLSHDPIIHVRMNIVGHIFDLLKSKPEQEVNLLKLGCNKIGDIDNKVSSKTSYQILQLEQAHPNMKKIVIDAIVDNVFKINSDYHTKYYSVLTLNQTILTRREDETANVLVKTYFALFEKLLIESDPNNVDVKKPEDTSKENNYKNRKKNFKKGKKGGKSVKNTKTEQEVLEEKNSKLFSALLTGLNRAFPFSNLPTEVFNKHLETLYKITHSSNFNTSVQALVLISQIVKSQNLNADRYYRTLYESLFDTRLVTSSKQGIYLNLLYKSLKQDTNISRIMAFVKRIVQICYGWLNIGSVAGMFYLLTELEKSIPQIRNLLINTPVDHKYVEDDDSEEEHFKDVDSDKEDGENQISKKKEESKTKTREEYDGRKRDPKFANASQSSLWEINEFLNHYHPTVQLYAESFLNKQKQAKPDLGLFTLSHFLDRFVYRNAKQKPTTKGSSIMQPLGGAHTGSLLVKSSNKINPEVPVNTEDWLNKKVEDIRPDEKFFYQYFTSKEKDPSQINGGDIPEEEFENESDLDDEEVWDALVKSQPEIEGDDESDLDDLSDLDEADFSDLSEDDDDEEQEAKGEVETGEGKVDEDDEDPSDFELQAIGDSDDDEEQGSEADEINEESDEEFGSGPQFDDDEVDEDDNEAELFKGDSEDEIGSDEDFDEESSEEEEEEKEKGKPKSKKRSLQEDTSSSKKSKKSKKSTFKDLPVFASADDYAQYLDSEDEDYS